MEDSSFPLVTVVMPTYNAENYIIQAIDSVMKQTSDAGVELIVIDDGSSDQTESAVKDYIDRFAKGECAAHFSNRSLRYIKNTVNLGVAETRNRGIREAAGRYIAFLDSDDWWSSDKLEKQLEALRQRPDAVLCATGRELMHADGTRRGKVISIPERISYRRLLHTNDIPCSSVIMKTEIAKEFEMCHDELHEDYILWLKVTRKYGDAVGVDEPLLKSRMSEGGKSRNKWKSAKMTYGTYRYIGIGRLTAMRLMVSYTFHGVAKYI